MTEDPRGALFTAILRPKLLPLQEDFHPYSISLSRVFPLFSAMERGLSYTLHNLQNELEVYNTTKIGPSLL